MAGIRPAHSSETTARCRVARIGATRREHLIGYESAGVSTSHRAAARNEVPQTRRLQARKDKSL